MRRQPFTWNIFFPQANLYRESKLEWNIRTSTSNKHEIRLKVAQETLVPELDVSFAKKNYLKLEKFKNSQNGNRQKTMVLLLLFLRRGKILNMGWLISGKSKLHSLLQLGQKTHSRMDGPVLSFSVLYFYFCMVDNCFGSDLTAHVHLSGEE